MEKRIHDIAGLFVANGYGFGKYWNGYIFGKNPKDEYSFFISDNRMAVLSAGIDEDGQKSIVTASDTFRNNELDAYFALDHHKTSAIQWLDANVNMLLLTVENKERLQNNIGYYMWPAVDIRFTSELTENTIVVYDRDCPYEKMEKLQKEAEEKNISGKVEYWSMVKMLTMGDRFGELAPQVCMETHLKAFQK